MNTNDYFDSIDYLGEAYRDINQLEEENSSLKEENRKLRDIIKAHETEKHEWHAENGAVIKDAV